MESTLFLFLLQGLVCFLSNKGSFCTPLHGTELLNADYLDNNWFTEEFNGLTYRDDDEFVLKGEDPGESAEEEGVAEDGGGGEGHEGGRENRGIADVKGGNKGDDKDKNKGDNSKDTSKENKPSGETTGSTKSMKDASTGSSSKPSEGNLNADVSQKGEEEEEYYEEGEEDDEEGDMDLEYEEDDDEGEGDDNEDGDEETEEESDKSEKDNVAAGGARVTYQEVTASNTHIPTKSYVDNTVTEESLVEDVARFPDPPPQVTNLVNHPNEEATTPRPASPNAAQPSRPRNPILQPSFNGAQSSRPYMHPSLSSNTGVSPIILPIVFVPFDMNTNRVNLPAQYQTQSQSSMTYPPQSQFQPTAMSTYPYQPQYQQVPRPSATYPYQTQFQPAEPRPLAEQPVQYPPPPPRRYVPPNNYAQSQSARSPNMQDLELLVIPTGP